MADGVRVQNTSLNTRNQLHGIQSIQSPEDILLLKYGSIPSGRQVGDKTITLGSDKINPTLRQVGKRLRILF